MVDLSQYSTEELKSMLRSFDEPKKDSPDLSGYSTEELKSMLKSHPEPGVGSSVGAGVVGAADILPFSKDIASAGKTAASYLWGNELEGTAGERFSQAKKDIERKTKRIEEEHPVASTVGKGAGIVASIPMMEFAAPVEAGLAARFAPAVGKTAAEIGSAGVTGAGLGATQGLGEGTTLEERLQNAKDAAVFGGAAGSALSGISKGIGKLKSASATPKPLNEAEQAAADLGVPLPRFLGSESPWQKKFATFASAMPFGGARIRESAQEAKQGLEGAIDTLTGVGRPSKYDAGETAHQAIVDWMKPKSSAIVERAYDRVDNLINPKIKTPLTNARAALNNARTKLFVQGLVDHDATFAPLLEGPLSRATGLSYEGIKGLRTRVIEKLGDPQLLTGTTERNELLNLKKALTADLENAVQRSGGPQAKAAWEKANRLNMMVQNRRDQLAKIVGVSGDVPFERVFDRISGLATNGSSANLARLKMARKSMAPDDWEQVTSGVIGTLGRNRAGTWSPVDFVTQYGSMPEASKTAMFGPTSNPVRKSLDDILKVSGKFHEMKEFANPSGTAQVATGISLLVNPFGFLWQGPLSARVISKILSKPRTAPAAARVTNAYYDDLIRRVNPESATSATQIALRDLRVKMGQENKMVAEDNNTDNREQRASGGAINKRDYPAKRLTRLERAAKRAQDQIALETKPIMNEPDAMVAKALEIANGVSNG